MPASTGGGDREELMNIAKASNKEDYIIILQYLNINISLPLCVTLHAFQSKPTTKLLNQGSF